MQHSEYDYVLVALFEIQLVSRGLSNSFALTLLLPFSLTHIQTPTPPLLIYLDLQHLTAT